MTKPNKINNGKLTLTAFGAAIEVGRSAFILEDEDNKILIDCGIKLQPKRAPSLAPEMILEHAPEITSMLLSHAHIDHSGYVPAIFENGYSGKLFMTSPTRDIVRLLWEDQIKIDGRHWSADALDDAYTHIAVKKYKEVFEIGPGITAEFYNAGHILGAAMILIDWKGYKILYTGDINDQQTPLFDGFDIPDVQVDLLISETTNGLRRIVERKNVNVDFVSEIRKVLDGGNKVIIPSFAIGRSQELLCVLTEHIKDYPIYIDGMINKMIAITELYLTPDWVDEPILSRLKHEKIYSPFKYDNITQILPTEMNTHNFRRQLGQSNDAFIIVTTSGMMEPSPLHTHLRYAGGEKRNLIAVTGYQAEGTTGREVMEGKRKIKLSVGRNKEQDILIKARVKRFGFSGHTSGAGIEDLISAIKPKRIFLIHGDPSNQSDIANKVTNGVVPEILQNRAPVPLQ